MGDYSPYAIAEDKTPEWKPGENLAAAAFIGIAIFIVLDVNVGIWRVFRKPQGLYYWSMKLGTTACLLDAIGVILKYMTPNPYHLWPLYTTCLLAGWSVYAPAQLLVLYSRLHLVNDSRMTQRLVFVMVLSTFIFLIIPTWIVVWPAYDPDPTISSLWSPRDAFVERYTQIGFTLVEAVLSGVYIWSLLGLLNLKSSVRQRQVMLDLIYVNLIIVSLDIVVVILIYLNQTGISHPMQTFSYALKLKLEFVVLNQLMAVAARGVQRANFAERRYHTSAADAFSAECREWDRKTPNVFASEHQGLGQRKQESFPSNSVQITVPSPALSRQARSSRDIFGIREPQPARSEHHSLQSSSRGQRGSTSNHEKAGGEEQGVQFDSFLDIGDNEADAIRHKPSEAFSGETLQSSGPDSGEASPRLYPRPVRNATGQMLRSLDHASAHKGQKHDRTAIRTEDRAPHRARIRRRVPQNGRDLHDESEEEEIGVHMWENRKGSLVLEVPWFNSKVGR